MLLGLLPLMKHQEMQKSSLFMEVLGQVTGIKI